MEDYKDLMIRLAIYSINKEHHGGIIAEAADAISQLVRERDALLEIIYGDCELSTPI